MWFKSIYPEVDDFVWFYILQVSYFSLFAISGLNITL